MAKVYRDSVPLAELPQLPADDIFHHEWATYLREAPRLLREGHEGKAVVIKGTEVCGIYATWQEAHVAGVQQFLLEPFLVKELYAQEPLVRARGISLPWSDLHFRSRASA